MYDILTLRVSLTLPNFVFRCLTKTYHGNTMPDVLVSVLLSNVCLSSGCIMSADLDLSPPEVPEPTFFESLLRYGLFLGAIFQLICILAVIIPTSKSHEQVRTSYIITVLS